MGNRVNVVLPDGRVVSVLEGGYNLHGLAAASHAHVEALIGRAIPVRETRPANY